MSFASDVQTIRFDESCMKLRTLIRSTQLYVQTRVEHYFIIVFLSRLLDVKINVPARSLRPYRVIWSKYQNTYKEVNITHVTDHLNTCLSVYLLTWPRVQDKCLQNIPRAVSVPCPVVFAATITAMNATLLF